MVAFLVTALLIASRRFVELSAQGEVEMGIYLESVPLKVLALMRVVLETSALT